MERSARGTFPRGIPQLGPPGFAGVRSVKWLAEVTVQDQPSAAHPQARDYKLFPPGVTKETANWRVGRTINEMPLNSVICEPAASACLPAGGVTFRGYAVSGEQPVVRVEMSLDGGDHWAEAELEDDLASGGSWTFWRYSADLRRGGYELVVRAWDAAGRTQPASLEHVWNFRGYLNSAWHRVAISVV